MDGISRTTLLASVVMFGIGVVSGTVTYLQRSPAIRPHDPSANAILVQIVLAVIGVGLILALPRLDPKRRPRSVTLTAPFSWSALYRVKQTILVRSGAPVISMVRAVIVGLLTIALMYNLFRAGEQVAGGLDPNFTVNAWGGPSYLGAMLAHYLDAIYLFYIEAILLNIVLLRPHDPSL